MKMIILKSYKKDYLNKKKAVYAKLFLYFIYKFLKLIIYAVLKLKFIYFFQVTLIFI